MTAQADTAGGNGQPLTVTVVKGGRITDYPDRLAMFHVTEWAKYLEDKQRRVHVADVVILDGEGAPILLPALELSHAGVYGAMNETERTLGVILHKGKGRGRWMVEADHVTEEQMDLALAYLDAEKAGTLAQVQGKAQERVQTDDRFTDSRLAERVAEEVMADRFIWVAGLKWMSWDGTRWALSEEKTVRRAVMDWVIERFEETIEASKGTGRLDKDEVKGWMAAQGRNKIEAVCDLAAGIVLRRAYELDTHPDLLNTPAGVVDLRTGQILDHDPALMMTQITSGSYRPGHTHPDWTQALEALPPEERAWLQRRAGQAITARQPHDDRVLFLQGSGDNGKSAVTSHGLVPALGGYGRMVSVKLLQSSRGNDHPTEIADLRGRRLVLGEELTEHRAIDVGLLKRLQGTGRVTARSLYKDPIEFDLTHTLVCTTNYTPRVDETDHGTWRRLAMVKFPFTFRRKDEELVTPNDRHGDSGLRDRLKADRDGQHDAIVTWAVEGAMAYFADPDQALALTDRVKADTREWQMDADRILGFWAEVLDADPKAFILTAELLNVFNRWLRENGHQEWAKETFHPRFLQHSETAQHRVDKVRVREPRTGLSRPENEYDQKNPIPAQPEVYRGVRFRSS